MAKPRAPLVPVRPPASALDAYVDGESPKPSKERKPSKALKKRTGGTPEDWDGGQLTIRMHSDDVRAIHVAALEKGLFLHDFVLNACRSSGAKPRSK